MHWLRTFFQRLKLWITSQVVTLSLLALVLATSWSLLTPQFFRVHDYTHAARISELARAVADGQFPVRWSQNLGYGYGMPLFNYYAPLPYYVGAIFYGLGLDVIVAIKILFVLAAVIVAVGAYRLGRDWFGTWGGLLTAAALTMAPYRAVNLYVRGALSEAWAIAFLPWIIWALCRLIRGQKSAWVWLVAALVGLFLSHNITTMLFLPVSGLIAVTYALLQWRQQPKAWKLARLGQTLWQVGSAYVMSVAVAAFYLLPSFLEKDLTKVQETVLSPYFDYHLHFLYIRQFLTVNWGYGGSSWGPNDDISFFLGAAQLVAVVAAAGLSIWQAGRLIKKKGPEAQTQQKWSQLGLVLVGAGVTALALFMSLEKSLVIWEALKSVLAFTQFPWRWLSVGVTGLALLVGAVAMLLPRRWWRNAFLAGLWLWLVLGNTYFFRPEKYLPDATGYYYTDPTKIRSGMSDVLPDYIPKQMAKKLTPATQLWLNPDLNEKAVTVLTDRTAQKLLSVQTNQPLALDLAVADFPTWQAEIDGQPVAKAQGTIGNVQVQVPAGEHVVGLTWRSTPIEATGNWLTVLAIAILLGLGLRQGLVLAKPKV